MAAPASARLSPVFRAAPFLSHRPVLSSILGLARRVKP